MRQKPPHMMSVAQRKMSSQEEINKRLSLPADLKLPDNFVEKLAVSPTLDGPLSRATRRQSLSEIGGSDNNDGNPEVNFFCSISFYRADLKNSIRKSSKDCPNYCTCT